MRQDEDADGVGLEGPEKKLLVRKVLARMGTHVKARLDGMHQNPRAGRQRWRDPRASWPANLVNL